jgi:uncharacterized protein YndB with AHSA1/START domain
MMIFDNTAVIIERTLSASPDRVFKAFTNPASLAKWWGMKDSCIIHCEADAKVGGKWRIGTISSAGKEHWVHGFYREVVPPSRLVFTWIWEPPNTSTPEMLVDITLVGNDRQTNIRIIHKSLTTDRSRLMHKQGWLDSLDALSNLLMSEEAT